VSSVQELEKLREERAQTMIDNRTEIRQTSDSTFIVPSQTEKGKAYQVMNAGEEWDCECPDFYFRGVICKHIYAVQLWKVIKNRIIEDETVSCPKCGSIQVRKSGLRKNKSGDKQRFECIVCGKRFVEDLAFKGMKADGKTIALALDLFYKGMSQRKIKDTIQQFMSIEVSQPTINRYIQRFTRLINEYAETLKPQVGDVFAVDELKLKQGGKWSWLWTALDRETRFWLCSHISTERGVSDARVPLRKAKEVAGKKHRIIITDGLQSYRQATTSEYFTLKNPRTKHIREIHFTSKENNNMMERLNGTIREREKVTRNLKDQTPLIIEGLRNYYNMIRPHSSLNGKTPSEACGIKVEGENKWLTLIQNASKKS
jgi:transposase-like protein/ssDNA-binding Zn-finger/Zn-ribbon topoisomerase 1